MADRGSKEKGPVEHGDVDRGGDDHGSEASFRSRADGEEYDSESDGAAGLVRRRRHGEASGSEDEDDREDRDERESIEEGAGRPPLYSDEEDDVDIDDDGIGEVGASEFDDEVILVDMAARSKRQDEERLMLLEDDDDGEEEDGRGDTGGEADLLVDGQEGGVGLRRQVPEGDEGGVAEEDDSADNDEEVLRREGQLKNTVGAVETEGLQDKASKKDVEPFVVPTSGAFYMHDDRFHENGGGRPRRNLGGRKLWEAKDDSPWVHDKFEELNLQDEEFNRSRSGRGSRGHRGQARGGFGVRTAAFRGGNAGRGRVRGRGRGQGQGGQWNTEGKLTEVSSASKTHGGDTSDISGGVERDVMDRQQKAPIVGSPGIIVDEAPRQIVRVPGLSHQAVTRVEPESTRGSDNATWSDGRQQEGYFDCSKYGSSGGSGRVVGRVGRERGRGGSSCGIGYTSMGVRAGGVGRVTSATNSAARKVVIGRTGTSGSVAGGAPSAPATSGGGEGVSSEGAAVIPLSGLVEEPQMSTSSDPGHKPQRHQTMTKTQALGTTQVQMSSTQLQLRPQVSSAAQSEETQQPSKKAIVSQLNPTVQVFLPQSYRLAQAQAQAQAQQQTAIAAPQVRGPQQAAKPGGQQPALVASVPTAGEQCQLPQKTSSGVLGVTGPGNNTRFRTAGSGRGGSSGTRSGGSAGYQVPGGVGSVASLGVTGNSYTYSAGGATAVPGGPAVHIDRAYGPVAIPYGQSQGGLAVPAMSVAVTSSYPNQAQYAYPNSEVTWVPVITPGGAVAGGYGAPFLPLEPPGAIYFAPPAVDSVQVGSGRAGSDLVLQPPMGKAVNMHGGALRGVHAVGGTGKSQAGLWKPPPQSQPQIPAGPVGGDDFGQRQNKPRRYSEMNFNS